MSKKDEYSQAFQQTIRTLKLFFAGGIAGGVARTSTAPLDRIKLLLQVQHLGHGGTRPDAYTGVRQAFVKIFKEEGFRAYWKGNGANVIRIFPYSAAQMMSHEQYKMVLSGDDGELTIAKRLTAGALAGMTATTLTHPLDTLRLRLALPNSGYNGMMHALMTISKKEGFLALYKGIIPTVLGIAPYAAINFALYDILKKFIHDQSQSHSNQSQTQKSQSQSQFEPSIFSKLAIGAISGSFATSACYPLDTVRRRMQMKGHHYTGMMNAFITIHRIEGVRGFYRGWFANFCKMVPQNSIRFVIYEFVKDIIGVVKKKTDT